MAAPKRKFPVSTTPKGTLIWPHFNIADTKFADPGQPGEYRTTFRVSDEDGDAFIAKFKAQADAAIDEATDKDGNHLEKLNRKKAIDKGVSYPWKRALDKEGEEIGGWDITFKVSEGGVDRKTGERYSNKPKQFDSSFPPKPVNLELRSGTIAKISFTTFQWATAGLGYGLSLRPKAVQVIRLAARGDADASYFGFEGDEDGFEHDDEGASDFTEKKADSQDEFGQGYVPPTSSADYDEEIPF